MLLDKEACHWGQPGGRHKHSAWMTARDPALLDSPVSTQVSLGAGCASCRGPSAAVLGPVLLRLSWVVCLFMTVSHGQAQPGLSHPGSLSHLVALCPDRVCCCCCVKKVQRGWASGYSKKPAVGNTVRAAQDKQLTIRASGPGGGKPQLWWFHTKLACMWNVSGCLPQHPMVQAQELWCAGHIRQEPTGRNPRGPHPGS